MQSEVAVGTTISSLGQVSTALESLWKKQGISIRTNRKEKVKILLLYEEYVIIITGFLQVSTESPRHDSKILQPALPRSVVPQRQKKTPQADCPGPSRRGWTA